MGSPSTGTMVAMGPKTIAAAVVVIMMRLLVAAAVVFRGRCHWQEKLRGSPERKRNCRVLSGGLSGVLLRLRVMMPEAPHR